ncbi:hypothetical protein B0H14DRAFT_2888164 [Mycena olivaceomarginata]|nr:hypothetical protein B0H14DRAFT_2888164 [Mycena olivaceomarginata]
MPPRSFIKTKNILEYTAVAATALRDAAGATQMPFLNSVCALSSTIVAMVQNTRIHRERYLRIVEDVHQSLCALMSLCYSEDIRSPKLLEEVAQYAGILQKFHACLRAQEELGTFKRFFKQSEMATQLDCCETELRDALHGFTMNYGVGIASSLLELDVDTEQRHQELLELISSQSVSSDNGSSMPRSSLNLRQEETIAHHLVSLTGTVKVPTPSRYSLRLRRYSTGGGLSLQISSKPLRLNPRGSLFSAPEGWERRHWPWPLYNHPTIVEKYAFKYFISCESANTHADMVTTIGLHLGLEPSRQLAKAIVHHFVQCNSCLLVLDNLETPWEPLESRGQVEDFLSLLTDIPSLALLVTMRGAERPGKVKWHRPFLAPLEPLSASASRQIFLEVADDPASGEESALHDLLDLSGSLPLAHHSRDIRARYLGGRSKNIALLSDGHDKRSPRLSSSPHAKYLLALLSLLPDGIRAEELMASHVPIPDIRQSQTLLLRTSLAHMDTKGRIKALSPIREYIRRVHPPSAPISRPLRIYFQDLLELWHSTRQLPSGNLSSQLVGYLGNINTLMLNGLITDDRAALKAIGYSIVTLDEFSAVMIKGNSPLFQRLPHLIEVTGDPVLRWRYGRRCLRNPDSLHSLSEDPDVWIEDGAKYFGSGNHSAGEAVPFYDAVAWHHHNPRFLNIPKAIEFNRRAFALAQEAADVELQLMALKTEYNIAYRCGATDRQIQIVQKARDLARFGANPSYGEADWLETEAWVNIFIGNLPRALDLCRRMEEIVSNGMQGTNRDLTLLDIPSTLKHGGCHDQIVSKTSVTSSRRYRANSLISMAYLDILTERPVLDILANLRAAEAVYESLGLARVAELQLYRGDQSESVRGAFLQCLAKSRGIYPDLQGFCLASLGEPRHAMHDTAETFHWAVLSLAFVRKMKEPVGILNSLRRLANVHIALHDDETALHLFRAALEGGIAIGIHRLNAECMVGIGDILVRRGDLMQAKEMWAAACPLFVRSSRMKDAAAVQVRLQQLATNSGSKLETLLTNDV